MKKHIVCFGDSNTHGHCSEPWDSEDGGNRFNEKERWTCLLQEKLGADYLVIEEGLGGRTTVFPDPVINEGMDGASVLFPILRSHAGIDLLIVMLGTNDTKERFHASSAAIGRGMERLVRKALSIDCWNGTPRVLIVAPPPITEGFFNPEMGEGLVEKSRGLAKWYKEAAEKIGVEFLDANGCEFNNTDHMHLSRKGHSQLAERMFEKVNEIFKK